MPDGSQHLGRHHIVRYYPRRIEVRPPAVCIKKSPYHEIPTHVVEILPRPVERVAPAARAQLVHELWIADRAPYPTDTGVPGRTEILRICYVDTAHTDIERMLAHVPFHRFYRLGIPVTGYTGVGLPGVGRVPVPGIRGTCFFDELINLFFNESFISILGLVPCGSFFPPPVPALGDDYLYPHLFRRLQNTHSLQNLRKGIYLELFFRVLIELKVYICTDRICVIAGLISPISREAILRVIVKFEFRGIILYFHHFNFRIVRIHHRLHVRAPITPTPYIEVQFTAERCNLERKNGAHLPLPDTVEKGSLPRVGPELRKSVFHRAG